MDRRINSTSQELKYRVSTQTVAVLDITCALLTMGFHGYTIFAQEMNGDKKLMPLSPVGLGLFGYIVVMAWIGIISVNILQLCVAIGLFRGTSIEMTDADATKSLGCCRLWMKTCFFIEILLVSKLVILYFISQLGTTVTLTVTFCMLELVGRIIALGIIAAFLHELSNVFPDIYRMYYDTHVSDNTSPKRSNVADAVWF